MMPPSPSAPYGDQPDPLRSKADALRSKAEPLEPLSLGELQQVFGAHACRSRHVFVPPHVFARWEESLQADREERQVINVMRWVLVGIAIVFAVVRSLR